MLAIEVAFLTGRSVATAYNSRADGEWPPDPARLFSALAATHFATDESLTPGWADERAVLEWLERQEPPSIVSSDATPRDVVTVFVPVNDVALTNVDEETETLGDARAALAAAQASGDAKAVRKREQAARKAEASLRKAIARATEVPTKALSPSYGARLLPEQRGRQPRTFPSMTPDEPRVTFVWENAAPSAVQLASLDRLLQRLVRLGHSSSLVSARVVDGVRTPTWRPAVDGEKVLRGIDTGQLAALQNAYERHREVEPRVMPSVPHAYTSRIAVAPVDAPRSLFSTDWLVLRRVGGPTIPMTATAGVARAIRRTLMSFADEPIPETITGHTADGRVTEQSHLAIVPLPFVGHPNATGSLLGIALMLPRVAADEDRRAVYAAVARWEEKYRQEDEDIPRVQLNLGTSGELHLERVEWGTAQASLRSATWCGPARAWTSVTPVALDRNPGDLRSRDTTKLEAALAEAVESLSRACGRVGLPVPKEVETLPSAPWAGAAKARLYPGYPGDASRTQRVLTHVRLEFERPVRGPVLLGAGRFVGLGLFRPEVAR